LQEVFTVARFLPDDPIDFSFHLAKSPFLNEKKVRARVRRYRIVDYSFNSHQYTTGGQDQVCLTIYTSGAALELLEDPTILSAIRLFNVCMMKKGANANGRSHCMDLADLMIEPVQ
jgi:hypothetical protein